MNRTVAHFFAEVYQPIRLPGDRPKSIRLYNCLFRIWQRQLGRPPLVADLTDEAIAGFLRWYLATPIAHRVVKALPSTQAAEKYRSQLLALGNFAFRRGLLRCAPECFPLPNNTDGPTPDMVLTPEQVGRLLATIAKVPGQRHGIALAGYWRAVILTLWDTGCRPGPLWKISPRHVSLTERYIVLPASAQKHRKTQRLRLHPDTITSIAGIYDPARALLFPPLGTEETQLNWIKRLCRWSGIRLPKGKAFRIFRISCASWCSLGNVNPTQQLGHVSPATTQEHYLVWLGQQAADVVPRPVEKPST